MGEKLWRITRMSISGAILNSLIEFRNPKEDEGLSPCRVVIAEIGFIAVIPFAVVEMALATIANIFTCCFNGAFFDSIRRWNADSARAVFSALIALVTNICSRTLRGRDIAPQPPERRQLPPELPRAEPPRRDIEPPRIELPRRDVEPQVRIDRPQLRDDPWRGGIPGRAVFNPEPVRRVEPVEPVAIDPAEAPPVITGATFREKFRNLYESAYTTDELKRFRDALAMDDENRSVYNEALEWREINDGAVDALAPIARPAPAIEPVRQPSREARWAQAILNPQAPINPRYQIYNPAPAPELRGPVLDPHRQALFAKYELAPNATKVSDVMERMYARLPHPTLEQRNTLRQVTIPEFLAGSGVHGNRVDYKLEAGNAEWQNMTIKMLWAIFEKIPRLSPDELAAVQGSMLDAFENCSNRMSTEVPRMYYTYVERDLMDLYENALTVEESLIYELTQSRMELRDQVVNRLCPDVHNAASHNYFQRELNVDTFHLPPAPLCAQDDHYQHYAKQDQRANIINTFNRLYNEQVIPFVEQMIVDTGGDHKNKDKKVFKLKPAMFLEWLNRTNRMNGDAFEDEDMTKYKPEVVVAFLEEHNFIRRKA